MSLLLCWWKHWWYSWINSGGIGGGGYHKFLIILKYSLSHELIITEASFQHMFLVSNLGDNWSYIKGLSRYLFLMKFMLDVMRKTFSAELIHNLSVSTDIKLINFSAL